MSKQSEAKAAQVYQSKAPTCSSCIHCKSTTEVKAVVGPRIWHREINIHCDIGDFAVKKQGTCKKHVPK